MKVKKVRCLECNTLLEADYDKGVRYANCKEGCPNNVQLINHFRLSQPGSVVKAIDKTKVQAQDQETNEWWYLIEPETEATKKYTKWRGKYGGGVSGFIEGMFVEFNTEPMTFNECRIFLKTTCFTGSEGRIYSVTSPIEESLWKA